VADSQVISGSYLYFELERRYEDFRRVSDGHSSRGSLTTKVIGSLQMVMPPRSLVKAFDAYANPIIQKIVVLLHESKNLAAQRDGLLPKLLFHNHRLEQFQRRVTE
jgi:type I restriction enzyme S subunit